MYSLSSSSILIILLLFISEPKSLTVLALRGGAGPILESDVICAMKEYRKHNLSFPVLDFYIHHLNSSFGISTRRHINVIENVRALLNRGSTMAWSVVEESSPTSARINLDEVKTLEHVHHLCQTNQSALAYYLYKEMKKHTNKPMQDTAVPYINVYETIRDLRKKERSDFIKGEKTNQNKYPAINENMEIKNTCNTHFIFGERVDSQKSKEKTNEMKRKRIERTVTHMEPKMKIKVAQTTSEKQNMRITVPQMTTKKHNKFYDKIKNIFKKFNIFKGKSVEIKNTTTENILNDKEVITQSRNVPKKLRQNMTMRYLLSEYVASAKLKAKNILENILFLKKHTKNVTEKIDYEFDDATRPTGIIKKIIKFFKGNKDEKKFKPITSTTMATTSVMTTKLSFQIDRKKFGKNIQMKDLIIPEIYENKTFEEVLKPPQKIEVDKSNSVKRVSQNRENFMNISTTSKVSIDLKQVNVVTKLKLLMTTSITESENFKRNVSFMIKKDDKNVVNFTTVTVSNELYDKKNKTQVEPEICKRNNVQSTFLHTDLNGTIFCSKLLNVSSQKLSKSFSSLKQTSTKFDNSLENAKKLIEHYMNVSEPIQYTNFRDFLSRFFTKPETNWWSHSDSGSDKIIQRTAETLPYNQKELFNFFKQSLNTTEKHSDKKTSSIEDTILDVHIQNNTVSNRFVLNISTVTNRSKNYTTVKDDLHSREKFMNILKKIKNEDNTKHNIKRRTSWKNMNRSKSTDEKYATTEDGYRLSKTKNTEIRGQTTNRTHKMYRKKLKTEKYKTVNESIFDFEKVTHPKKSKKATGNAEFKQTININEKKTMLWNYFKKSLDNLTTQTTFPEETYSYQTQRPLFTYKRKPKTTQKPNSNEAKGDEFLVITGGDKYTINGTFDYDYLWEMMRNTTDPLVRDMFTDSPRAPPSTLATIKKSLLDIIKNILFRQTTPGIVFNRTLTESEEDFEYYKRIGGKRGNLTRKEIDKRKVGKIIFS